VHMRKAGGTTIHENICRSCHPAACRSAHRAPLMSARIRAGRRSEQLTRFSTAEFGLYDWTKHPNASRVTSLRPPMERLVSSYLYEQGYEHCWRDTPTIDLEGDGRNWSAEERAFVESCYARYAKLAPLSHLVQTLAGTRGRQYMPNVFHRPLTRGYCHATSRALVCAHSTTLPLYTTHPPSRLDQWPSTRIGTHRTRSPPVVPSYESMTISMTKS